VYCFGQTSLTVHSQWCVTVPPSTAYITPQCNLPRNISGEWFTQGIQFNSKVIINDTHIKYFTRKNEFEYEETYLSCQQTLGTRYLMTKVIVGKWWELCLCVHCCLFALVVTRICFCSNVWWSLLLFCCIFCLLGWFMGVVSYCSFDVLVFSHRLVFVVVLKRNPVWLWTMGKVWMTICKCI